MIYHDASCLPIDDDIVLIGETKNGVNIKLEKWREALGLKDRG